MPITDAGVFVPDEDVPPPPEVPLARGIQLLWMGWDGSVWDLSDWSSGAFLMQGTVGLGMPDVINHYRSESPQVNGASWRGYNVGVRQVKWRIALFGSNSADWVVRDRAFWKTMNPAKTGTWVARLPDGTEKRLDLRFADDGQFALDRDPTMTGWSIYDGVELEAEQPLWRGLPVVRPFDVKAPVPFYVQPGDPDYAGYPTPAVWRISEGSSLDTASIPNPGDVDAFVDWQVNGPWSTGTVGVAGGLITLPPSRNVGESVSLFSRPELMLAIDQAGRDVTDEIGAANWKRSRVAPGLDVPLSIALTGVGDGSLVTASLEPLYLRAVS